MRSCLGIWKIAFGVAIGLALGSCAGLRAEPGRSSPAMTEHAPAATLDALHDAASKADGERYFALFTPDAVFLGTDATERWTLAEFKAYAQPIFARGRGWTYTPSDRHIMLSTDGATAWFDERVTNAKYGECRGTGVLQRGVDGQWRVAQYNLTKPVPNDLMDEFVQRMRDHGRGPAQFQRQD